MNVIEVEQPINRKAIAAALNVHPDTITRLCIDRKIPHVRVGRCYRFYRSEVIASLTAKGPRNFDVLFTSK